MSKAKKNASKVRDQLERSSDEESMSSPIDPTQHAIGTQPTNPAAAVSRAEASSAVDRATPAGGSVLLDAIPASPPQEVLDQMANAAHQFERISSEGKQLRFVRHDEHSPTVLEVSDADGAVERRLSLVEAFELAAGEGR